MFDPGGAAGGALGAVNPWLAAGQFALPVISGALGGGQQQENIEEERKQRWREFLLNLQQQRSEQGDSRARTSASLSSKQAMLPLVDRGFSGLQQRYGQGPAAFGQVGAQNRDMQAGAAAYQPGQNPSINQLGTDWGKVQERFQSEPADPMDANKADAWQRVLASGFNRSKRTGGFYG